MNLYIFNQNSPMMSIRKVFIASFALLLGACSTTTTMNYNEPYRLQYHFSPQQKWMNDPNGLIFENGTYHLFYQYYPEDIVWGPMHWGHAVSKDLIHWEHKPIALFPDEHGYIFSGSAVYDKENTSGLGTTENPPLIAIFTYHKMEAEKAGEIDYQTQGIAYSLDHGDTWTMYQNNPVIANPGVKDFRDPKVFWHESSSSWIMSLVAGDHLQLFRSSNLIDWELSSTFGQGVGAHGGVWECPDLFELELNGEKHWVLLISINPGGPNGGSATQYFVGDFDGYTFSTDQEDIRWVDHGPDNYAGVTYNDVPDDSRVFIGWMSNWAYAQETPTEAWRSSMTLPRKLSLFEATDGVRLQSQILDSVNSLKSENPSVETLSTGQSTISFEGASQSKILLETAAEAFSFSLQNDTERVIFSVNRADGEIVADRSKSGNVSFSEAFTSEELTADISYINDESLTFEIYVDTSSIELLVAGGKTLMTLQVFPDQGYNQIAIDNPTNEIIQLEKERLKGIW